MSYTAVPSPARGSRLLRAAGVLFLCVFPLWSVARAALPLWTFEPGAEGWSGVNATVAVASPAGEPPPGGSGGKALQVTMTANGTYDGARVDLSAAIPDLQAAFSAGRLVEISAWVKIPETSARDTRINLAFRAMAGSSTKFTYLDELRTGSTTGIVREDGWMRMRAVIASFREAWDESTNDSQTGAVYTPTSLSLIARSRLSGDVFLLDDVALRLMVPGELSSYSPPASSRPEDFLRPGPGSEGFRLLDARGGDVVLYGINLPVYSDTLDDPIVRHWNHNLYSFDHTDLARLAADYGMNVARVNLDYRWFEKSFNASTGVSVFKEEGWAWLDRLLAAAREAGVYLVLDLHAPPGGYQGPGTTPAAYFSDATLRTRTSNLWVALASRYRHEPIIAAYDLVNEPRPRSNADWFAEAQRLLNAIRSQAGDSNHLVLVEMPLPTDGKGSQVVRLSDPAGRVMYDNHFYSPLSFTFNQNTSSTYVSANTNLSDGTFGELSFVRRESGEDTIIAEMVPPVYSMTENAAVSLYPGQLTTHGRSAGLAARAGANAAPLNIGEFGIKDVVYGRASAAALAYIADLHQVLDFYCVSRQQWCYRGDFGLYPTYAGFAASARFRNAALHSFLAGLKSAREAMLRPEDTDNDQLADTWERAWFGSLTAANGSGDADGDGLRDLGEYLAGTRPLDPASNAGLRLADYTGSAATLVWTGSFLQDYTVERSTTLEPGSFVAVKKLRAFSSGPAIFTDTAAPAEARVFYRLRIGR